MRFVNPIIFVRDIAVSKSFYRDLIGLSIEQDHGDSVLFSGHLGIHAGRALIRTVWGSEAVGEAGPYGRRNLLLYFEDENVDECFARLADRVRLIHGLNRQAWGQRVFRHYDPDDHAVEIGEPLT
jgi:catechol 2,3-dioxygenase-like lactoylglutathione lyase family enzyme